MDDKYEKFVEAIRTKSKVLIKFETRDKSEIKERRCIPFDYAFSSRFNDDKKRYHFYDLDSADGPHNLSIFPEQLLSIDILQETFSPAEYVKWIPNWSIPRDW